MSAGEADSYLDLYLEPLRQLLSRSDVTDIYINKPGELWIETLGGRIERRTSASLDEAHLWRLARQIASHSHQGIGRSHPLLSATLPDGARVQVVAPPATRGAMALAIRRHAATTVPLASYAHQSALRGGHDAASRATLERYARDRDYPALLAHAVKARLNIVISGGTSAGKTTLLNSLLGEIPSEERLIFIEDTPELRLTHTNSIGLVAVRGPQGEAQVTAEELLQAALRMRPDRILLGELRGAEAFTFLRAINTGHPGSITTIHADSPERAILQLAMMSLQSGLGVSYDNVVALVSRMVDLVVQVERRGGRRMITDVLLGSFECAEDRPADAPCSGLASCSPLQLDVD